MTHAQGNVALFAEKYIGDRHESLPGMSIRSNPIRPRQLGQGRLRRRCAMSFAHPCPTSHDLMNESQIDSPRARTLGHQTSSSNHERLTVT